MQKTNENMLDNGFVQISKRLKIVGHTKKYDYLPCKLPAVLIP